MKDTKPIEGTGCTNTSTSIKLWWNQYKYTLNMQLNKISNMATFQSAPGYSTYSTCCDQCQLTSQHKDKNPPLCVSMDKDVICDEYYMQETVQFM